MIVKYVHPQKWNYKFLDFNTNKIYLAYNFPNLFCLTLLFLYLSIHASEAKILSEHI